MADGHRVARTVEYAVTPVFERQIFLIVVWAVGQGPPGFLLGAAIRFNAHPARRWQFFDTGQQCARRRNHGVEIQIVIERNRIEDRIDVTALEQRWQCRGKAQALAGARQVQRLDAQAVASNEQALAVAFPNGEGKHAVEFW
ncbi:hypothetical protein D3C76_1306790 [compost metagenome]